MSSMLGTQLRIETRWRRSNSTQVVGSAFCSASTAHQRATDREHAEDVVDRGFESQGGQREDSIGAADLEPFVHRVDRVHRGAMRYVDSLGQTRRTGRENHVGDLAGIGQDRLPATASE